YSAVFDNWRRVKIMFALASSLYDQTKDSVYRDAFPDLVEWRVFFSIEINNKVREETCIVESVMVWSVITIESLVNHAIAETWKGTDVDLAKAIDKPKQKGMESSDLQARLIILNGGAVSKDVESSAKYIADIRNELVHDKPFDYCDRDGDVSIKYFTNKGRAEKVFDPKFPDLEHFFYHCHLICKFVEEKIYIGDSWDGEIDFMSLKF
uniref:hypothetical protein n=1 Tax=Chromobacterium amazonense TaxID=1382803 RepID=UPI003F79AEE4